MAYVNEPIELAKCIVGMSYAGLLQVAHELVEMNKDPDAMRDVGTRHGMADTLADWAGSQVEEANERTAKAKRQTTTTTVVGSGSGVAGGNHA